MNANDHTELNRINDLVSYNILDTPAEEDFDRLARLASYVCDTPIALITLVDKDRQWFKSALGIAIRQTDLDISMCKYAISDTKPLIVEDISKDPRFCDYPSVKGDPHIRFYAGIPLISPRGYGIGTLCVIDHKPRQLDEKQLEALQTIADQVMVQMELRRQQTDLQNSLALQYDMSSQLGQVLDSALDMLCTMDAQGHFKQISASSAHILGYEPEELLGKSYLDLVVPDDQPKTIAMASDIMSGLFTRDFENRYITKSGNIVHMMWSAIWSAEADLFFCVARDITAKKHQEELDTNQAKILEQIAIGASSSEVLEQIIHMLEGQIDDCICSIMLLDKDGTHLNAAASPNLPAAYTEKIEGLEVGPVVGSCGTAVFRRQNVFVEDIQTDPLWANFKDLAAEHNLRACWSIPFYSGNDKVLGTFAVYFHYPRKPQPAELQLLAACSHLAGIVATREASQEHLHLLESCIACLNDIVLITEAEPIDETGPKIVFVNEAFEHRTGFSRSEAIGNTPRMLQGPKTQRSELNKIHKALTEWEPVRAELINYTKSGEEFWLDIDILPIANSKGWYTHWIAVERDITDRKIAELESTRVNRSLRMLSACHERLIHATDEKELIKDVCKIIVDIGNYKTAWIGYMQDDAEKSITPVAYCGDIKHIEEQNLSWSEDSPYGQGPGGRAVRTSKPVICRDIEADDTFNPWQKSAAKLGYRGLICLPLIFQEQTFGLLGIYSSEVLDIAEDELELLQDLLDNLAFGIMNIRARDEKERIQSGVIKVAAGLSASTDSDFFQQLALNMTEALGADAGFVARILPGEPLTARTVAGVCDGQVMESVDYTLKFTPCENVTNKDVCVIPSDVVKQFPQDLMLVDMNAEAYVGKSLINSEGKVIGLICVIYRKPLVRSEFILSTLKIIASRAAAEMERQVAYSRIRNQASLLDKAQDAIIVRDMDGNIIFWNKSAERLFGWTAEEAIHGKAGDSLHDDPGMFREAMQIVLAIGEWKCELPQRRKDGSKFTVEAHWSLVRDEDGKPQAILAIKTDITLRKTAENEIKYLAYYDDLTGLPNRRLLLDRLKQQLIANKRNVQQGAIFLIDLDNFKALNDTLGHDIGDLLLKEVATRLTNCVREGDTVARLGGDEFVVMLESLSIDTYEATSQATLVAKKILDAFSDTFELGGYKNHSTPSIGITLFDGKGENIETIMKKADLAMYQAKASGRNIMRFFDPEMQSVMTNRVELEDDIRHGLDNDEFVLAYQPQVGFDGKVSGAEALIRWNHSRRGVVSPAEFIPIAEETGMILPIGNWVLKTACTQLARWASSPLFKELTIAVNVSARQLRHADFVSIVLTTIEETGANPQKLKLELTESLLVDNVEDTIEKMAALKIKGINFSLDDFGTGYSSLIYLKRLPLEQLKIDQSFVHDILIDQNDATIATTIINLGQSLGLSVLAEGVETNEQRSFLASRGCFSYQGYFFSKPVPVAVFEAYVTGTSFSPA